MSSTLSLSKPGQNSLVRIAWPVMLLVSLLPDILFKEITGSMPAWLFWAKLALAAALLLCSLFWQPLRPLSLFFGVLLTVNIVEWAGGWFYDRFGVQGWFANANPFILVIGPGQVIRTVSAVLMVLVMLVILHRFERFFLVKGDLNAPAKPIPLILTRPPTWRILGPAIASAMAMGLLVFIFAFGRPPSLESLGTVLPLLPFVFLFAATNAFGEEMLYRAPWLAALETPVGPVHTLLITATYFGIGHFYGVPYGVLGCIMAFIPGWLNGKAMLETRGFFWAWFIHLWMDVVIFFFIALGAVSPGG